MILYHGSNVEVQEPHIVRSQRLLDFGTAFYLTSDFDQARKWAVRTAARRETGTPLVSVFQLDEPFPENLKVLRFENAGKQWLRYISSNRTERYIRDDYDLVIGPVADDQAIRTVNHYLKGYFSEDIAIQLLLPQNLKDQFAFKTEQALKALHFCEVKNV